MSVTDRHGSKGQVRLSNSSLCRMLVVLLLAFVCLGTMLSRMRQRRLELAYHVTKLHRQIGHSRTELWDLQTRIIKLARPTQLRQAIAEQGLFLEPAVGGDITRQRLLVAVQSIDDELGDGEY